MEQLGRESGQSVDPAQVVADVQEATERVRQQAWKISGAVPDEDASASSAAE